jgi:hypothetical protein
MQNEAEQNINVHKLWTSEIPSLPSANFQKYVIVKTGNETGKEVSPLLPSTGRSLQTFRVAAVHA